MASQGRSLHHSRVLFTLVGPAGRADANCATLCVCRVTITQRAAVCQGKWPPGGAIGYQDFGPSGPHTQKEAPSPPIMEDRKERPPPGPAGVRFGSFCPTSTIVPRIKIRGNIGPHFCNSAVRFGSFCFQVFRPSSFLHFYAGATDKSSFLQICLLSSDPRTKRVKSFA